MTKDGIAKELRRMLSSGISLPRVAWMLEMDPKTVHKYRGSETLPSQPVKPREHRTCVDPFADIWNEVAVRLEAEPRLKEVTFPEESSHRLTAASDFTSRNSLSVTIAGASFEHMLCHCVPTYSNYETFRPVEDLLADLKHLVGNSNCRRTVLCHHRLNLLLFRTRNCLHIGIAAL